MRMIARPLRWADGQVGAVEQAEELDFGGDHARDWFLARSSH
jgi:hypothetical protein